MYIDDTVIAGVLTVSAMIAFFVGLVVALKKADRARTK